MDWEEVAQIVGGYLREVILPLLGTLALAAGIAYLRSLAASTEDERLRRFIEELVRAAEQLMPGHGRGDEKLAWVMQAAQENGRDAPRPMIEAAVQRLSMGVCADE